MRDSRSRPPRQAHLLPPCRVCGEPGTGFHYGATTCGACKGFFRRCLVRSQPYDCVQSPSCTEGPYSSRKMTCPKCRYDKCVAAGMSRDACKVGRYTLIKRFKDTEEAMKYKEPQADQSATHTNGRTDEMHQGYPDTTPDISSIPRSNVDVSISLKPDTGQTSTYNYNYSIAVPASKPSPFDNKGRFNNAGTTPSVNTNVPSTTFSSATDTKGMFSTPQTPLIKQYIHQTSPDSSCVTLDSNGQNCFGDSTNSNDCLRLCLNVNNDPLEENVEESSETAESGSLSNTLTNKDSIVPCSCKSKTLARGNVSESKPLKLYIMGPDPMKNALSIFEQFPFKSFEKKSLSPLLKMCYDSNDWIDDYLNQPLVQNNRVWCNSFKPQDVSKPSVMQLNSMGLSMFAEDPTFDVREMDNLFNDLQDVHSCHYGPKSGFMSPSEMEDFMELFTKICQIHDSLQGKLNLIDDDKYFTIFESTGVDVDKRKQWFSILFDAFDDSFSRDVKYTRSLPGFKQLPLQDRILLTKNTFPFYMSFRHDQTIDYERDICIDQERGIAIRISTFQRILPHTTLKEWAPLSQALEPLKLSFEEVVILKAVIIMLPEYGGEGEGRQMVTEWHNTYLKCYLHHVRRHHGSNADDRFNKVVGIVQQVRELCALRNKIDKGALAETVKTLADGDKQVLMREVLGNC